MVMHKHGLQQVVNDGLSIFFCTLVFSLVLFAPLLPLSLSQVDPFHPYFNQQLHALPFLRVWNCEHSTATCHKPGHHRSCSVGGIDNGKISNGKWRTERPTPRMSFQISLPLDFFPFKQLSWGRFFFGTFIFTFFPFLLSLSPLLCVVVWIIGLKWCSSLPFIVQKRRSKLVVTAI